MIKYPCRGCGKAVGNNHHAIECDICHAWIHIKCNKFDDNDYKFFQDNPSAPFYCIVCSSENIPFSSLNNNLFSIAVEKGVNFLADTNVQLTPSANEQQLFNKINRAINNNALIGNDAGDLDTDDNDHTLDCKYYSIDEFHSSKFNSNKSFSVLHMNIHSVQLHIEELRIILKMLDFQFDFICLTESKIRKGFDPKFDINIDGYQPPFGVPTEATKGGVLLYAKVGINAIPRSDLDNFMYKSKELESVFIEVIDSKDKNSIVGVIYRHPCMDEHLFNEDYMKIFSDKCASDGKKYYISGDFNFDLLNVSSHNETFNFFDIMMSNLFLPTIALPTKINSVKSSVIDNIFTNHLHPDIKTGNLTVGISDHLPSFFIVPKNNQNHIPPKQALFTRKTKNFDRENFILDYLQIDWNETLDIPLNDANHSTQKFMDTFNGLLDKYMPLRKIKQQEFKQKYKPWISDEILNKIKYKNSIFKKYVKCKNADRKHQLFLEYKHEKNLVTHMTRISKKDYYHRYFTNHKNNLQKIWKGIKEIINIKSKNIDHPTSLLDGDKVITDPTEMANKFNNFFTSIADDILKKRKFEGNKSFRDYLSNPLPNSILFYDCDEIEIQSIIKTFDVKKATGPNSIDNAILSMLREDISFPLSKIFNLSLSTGVHPDMFKISKTIPIFKKGSRLQVCNYRPISLLSNLNKILEKLVFSRMYKFLEEYNCIYSLQFGFRAKHSTNHALIDITEKIRNALDNKNLVCGVFVDLQKAFDTVNHNILLSKLNHYGIRGTANNWLSSYLSNRSQYVSITGFDSTCQNIRHGVPQGSVLGPLLFLIYINDLHSSIKYSNVYHFADDTNLLNINKSPKQLQKFLNFDLKSLYNWLLANKISLNCSKTEIIFFRKPGDSLPDFNFNIKMNGHKIFPSLYIKYLGIYLDANLNGRFHCDLLMPKLKRAVGMLCKARHYVPSEELKSIYYAIFSSHLVYGCQVWGQSSNIHTEKIFKLQNRAMRVISFSDFRANSTPIFKAMKILRLEDFISLQNCLFVYDFLKNKLPTCFNRYFQTVKSVHDIDTKSSRLGCLFIPHVSTHTYGLNSITRKSITCWNYFSKLFKSNLSELSRSMLKNKLTSHFLASY